jgi:hypothetical protein
MPECEKWLQCAGLDSNRHVLELLTECQSIGLSRLQSEQATTIALRAACRQSVLKVKSLRKAVDVISMSGRYHRLALIAKICTDIPGDQLEGTQDNAAGGGRSARYAHDHFVVCL